MQIKNDLDGASIQSCLDTNTNAEKVTANLNAATATGIQATPTIYDMETDKQYKIEGALPYDSIVEQINTFKAAN